APRQIECAARRALAGAWHAQHGAGAHFRSGVRTRRRCCASKCQCRQDGVNQNGISRSYRHDAVAPPLLLRSSRASSACPSVVKCAAMIRPLELYIGLKYTRAKRRNHFISFISSISMGGIALAVMLLITVLSVMNGFESELRERILGMASHVEIISPDNRLADWQSLQQQIDARVSGVTGSAPYVSGQAMVRAGSRMSGVMLRGVVPQEEKTVSVVGDSMVAGPFEALQPGKHGRGIGSGLAVDLGGGVGDAVGVVIPAASVTPAGVVPRFRRFTVVGIFEVGMYEYDSGLVLMRLADAQAVYRLDEHITGMRLQLENMF